MKVFHWVEAFSGFVFLKTQTCHSLSETGHLVFGFVTYLCSAEPSCILDLKMQKGFKKFAASFNTFGKGNN